MSQKLCILLALLAAGGTLVGTSDKCLAQASSPAPTAPAATGASSAEAAQVVGEPEVFSEEWFKKTKEPVPWFKWGADFRIRDEYSKNYRTYVPGSFTLDNHAPHNESNWIRYRTRIWSTVTPVKDVDINTRLVWEFRTFTAPEYGGLRSTDPCQAVFDNLNVKYKNALGLPTTITAGRQDIILGDGWLVLDGTPLDGSRTIFFDAARATTEFKDANTTVDTIYIQQYAYGDKWISPLNGSDDFLLTNEDERGAILYVTNKSFKKTEISPYFIYKQDSLAHNVSNPWAPADTYAFGARVAQELDDHWRYRAELAQELGHRSYKDICALGFNSQLSYFVKDKLNNNFRMAFEYLSGDRESTEGTDEGFDVLWGRWPRFSELLAGIGFERLGGQYTNMYRVGPGWSFNPSEKMEVATDYNILFAAQNNQPTSGGFSEDGHFRGQLLTFLMKYTFNKHLAGHILNEYFFPGDYYNDERNDPAVFLRGELVFTW